MGKLFLSELLKIRKTSIWLLLFVSPLLSTFLGLFDIPADSPTPWLERLSIMTLVHALLFFPLLTGVFSAFVCRYEHIGGGWKQLLSLPVSRSKVYIVKFLIVAGMLAITQALFLVGLLFIGYVKGFPHPIPWEPILKSVVGGWIACLPLAALQMLVSIGWSSFAAPMALNVIFTIPNILVANSEQFAPYYPWIQPFLAMLPKDDNSGFNVSQETLYMVIVGSFVVFFVWGIRYLQRKEI